MGDQQDCAAVRFEFGDALDTFFLEGEIAYRQGFIDEQNFWLDVYGDGKRQAHLHAGAVRAQWAIDELLQFGKINDCVEALRYFLRVNPEITPLIATFSRPVKSG